MSPTAQLDVLTDADRLAVALPPLRRQLLRLLAQPDSATGLARRLDLPRQKINYHLRELERAGLVELVEERRRRGLVERRVRATARAWVIDPALLAVGSVEPTEFQDRFASAYLVATAARAIRDVATLRERAKAASKRLATFTLESEIAFGSPRDLRAFTDELEANLVKLSQRYHHRGGWPSARRADAAAPDGGATAVSREYSHEIRLGADQAAVWAALTDAVELGGWLVEVAHVEPRVGGLYGLRFGDGVELQSRIEAWEPGRRLRLSGPGPIIQEYTLEKDGDATTLRVVTSGIPDTPDWDGFVEGGRRGWEISLRGLPHYLERHRGEARHMARLRFDTALGVADSWERSTGPSGLGGDPDAEVLVSVADFGLLAEITTLDSAVLAMGVQPTPGGSQVWLTLSTYGRTTLPVEILEQWSERLERALGVSPVRTTP